MNNDNPKKSLFDIIVENSKATSSPPPKKEPEKTSETNPLHSLGLIIGPFFFSFFLYLGLSVIHTKFSTFPVFSYLEVLELYLGIWAVSRLLKK